MAVQKKIMTNITVQRQFAACIRILVHLEYKLDALSLS
jgi:hypothetical protein